MMDGQQRTTVDAENISFRVNGKPVSVSGSPLRRLAEVLRHDLGLTGTKVGCNAGDCGACTVLVDGEQICSCMMPVGQATGRDISTVEGLSSGVEMNPLQQAFQRHGAAQCGICTPGMLMAATDLLQRNAAPDRRAVMDALGGVLCRCTGYQKIVEAVLDVAGTGGVAEAGADGYVGARLPRIDGVAKVTGAERFGADAIPEDALWLRVIRSPHASAEITLGDMSSVLISTTAFSL